MAEAIAVLGVVSGTTSLAAFLADMAANLWNAAEAIEIINEETKFVKLEVTDLVPVGSQSLNHDLAKIWKVLKMVGTRTICGMTFSILLKVKHGYFP